MSQLWRKGSRNDRAPESPDHHQRSVWRDGAFVRVWLGQTTSLFGDQVTGLALPWLILLQTHSALDAGVISAVRYLPVLLFGLPAGLLADRQDVLDRRALMIAADLLRALALGVVASIGVVGRIPSLVLLAAVVAALGTGQLIFQAAYRAWLPGLTGEQRLPHATAALEAGDAVSVLAGFPLAGALIAGVGPVIALGADALSYVASAGSLLLTRRSKAKTADDGASLVRAGQPSRKPIRETFWMQTMQGVRALVATPEQRLLRGTGAAMNAAAGAITVLVATLTQLRLHLPAWQAGFVFGAMGVGGLLGSALAPRLYAWGWRRGLALAFALAAMGFLALALACMLAPGWGFAVALGADALTDGAMSLGFVLIGTATTLLTPTDLRGRVNAASSIFSNAVRAVALIASGALVIDGNPLFAFVALAACCLAASLAASRRA